VRRPLGFALLALLAVVACHRAPSEDVETQAKVPVEVATPRVGALTAHVRATGTVDPAPGADWIVTAPQAARIAMLGGATGDTIRKGAVVARFDAPLLRADLATHAAELSQAQARLENARHNHTRLTELLEKGIASRREVEDARKELLDAEAGLAQSTETRAASADLASRATAVAPFDGLVAQRWHNPGDLVDANEHVVRLVDPSRLEVTAAVLVADASRIVVGRAARVSVAGGTPEGLPAHVVGAPGAADPATGTALVRLELLTALPVGTPVQVEIEAETVSDAVVVPASALVRDQGKAAVFVVGAEAKAHRREVEIGLTVEDEIQIVSGLKAGEPVVVKGQENLPDGASVTIEKE
jgi:membrane fusion protein (multidrug efflux system)